MYMPDIGRWGELIIESNQEKMFLEMYELLAVRFPENHGKLILNEDKFRYAKVMNIPGFSIPDLNGISDITSKAGELGGINSNLDSP